MSAQIFSSVARRCGALGGNDGDAPFKLSSSRAKSLSGLLFCTRASSCAVSQVDSATPMETFFMQANYPYAGWISKQEESPKSSPNAPNFMAWGAHAPSHVAVGAPADRFFRRIYSSYWSLQAQHKRKARIRESNFRPNSSGRLD